jgi:hypothetical protein
MLIFLNPIPSVINLLPLHWEERGGEEENKPCIYPIAEEPKLVSLQSKTISKKKNRRRGKKR